MDRSCRVPDCAGKHWAKGRCKPHYVRMWKYGDDYGQLQSPVHGNYKGGRSIRSDGYVTLLTSGGRHVGEHRIVMEQMLGRCLWPGETVHHRNGVRSDNRPENLELWCSSQPAGQSVADLVAWAEEILALYGAQCQEAPRG